MSASYDMTQLSQGSPFQFLTSLRDPDEDYMLFLQNMFPAPSQESQNHKDFHCKDSMNTPHNVVNLVEQSENDEDFHCKDLFNTDHRVVNLVEESENAALIRDVQFVNLVETSENEVSYGDVQLVNLVEESENGVLNGEKSENEVSYGDGHFVSLVKKSENEVLDDDDPQYIFFLANLKGNGKAFTYEIKEANGLCKTIEYNKEEPLDGRHNLKRNRIKENVTEMQSKSSRSEPKGSEDVKKCCLRSLPPEKRNTPSHKHTSRDQSVYGFQPKNNKDGLGKMGEEQLEKSHSVGRHVMKREQDSGKKIVCDGEVNLSNVLSHEIKSLRPRTSAKNNVEEEAVCQFFTNPETYALKEQLMALLRKPFDEQEYNTLWHEVSQKKYKLRQSRDGESVPTKIKAKSYLQRHKGFRRAIKAVPEDKFKILNILRGFVFWLQHLPSGGIFKPWEDASCLAVMPGSH